MLEMLADALIDDCTTMESRAPDDGAGAAPWHGDLVLAFNPRRFLGAALATGDVRADRPFAALIEQNARLDCRRNAARISRA
jgi:LDH2 family malate/lactate/ureidoglycolate dehydrogenase